MELNGKLAELEKAIMGTSADEVECDGHCGCGCDESPVETEDEVGGGMRHCGDDYYDEGPEFDSAGFNKADRIVVPQQANTIVFPSHDSLCFPVTIFWHSKYCGLSWAHKRD